MRKGRVLVMFHSDSEDKHDQGDRGARGKEGLEEGVGRTDEGWPVSQGGAGGWCRATDVVGEKVGAVWRGEGFLMYGRRGGDPWREGCCCVD